MGQLRSKPRGLVRLLFKLPVGLYRLHLGWLLGHRFLLLTHRGRVSGRIHTTMLEVVHYDRATCESVVIAGYGAAADWLRNIQASPALEVQVRGASMSPGSASSAWMRPRPCCGCTRRSTASPCVSCLR